MFAAIYIPDFPVEAIVRAEPELREQAVAVVEGAPPLVHVVAVNERAAQAGIEPGMTKLQAEAMLVGIQRSVLDRQQPIAGTVRERAAEREAAAHAALLDSACGFSPRVEDTAVDTVVLDIAGLERIFGPPARMAREVARRCSEMGLEANVAVASNADTAVLAARGFAGVTVVPEGKEAERLGELGVEILASPHWAAPKWSEKDPRTREGACATNAREILETLERWGVRNLRALATLPAVAVAERLGQHGLYLQKLARGEMQRALVVAEPPLVFEEAAELDYPVEMLEPLAFVLNRMLEQLCARLAARALATNELKLMLTLDTNVEDRAIGRSGDRVIEHPAEITGSPDDAITRCLRLPVPMLDAKVFLKLLQLDLQAHPPQAPVAKVWLRAEPAEPRRAQNGLFVPEAPEPEKLELTIARINKVVGTSSALRVASPERNPQSAIGNRDGSPARVGSPQVVDTHAAEGWRMKPFVATGGHAAPTQNGTREGACDTQATVALRVFRPALHAVVTLRDGLPAHVASPERPAMRGEVVWCAGPWRSSGEWWSQQAWSRAEWDVAVKNEESVVLYRIYRDEIGGKWWVEGSYD